MNELYSECRLCARNCGIDRRVKKGACHSSADLYLARATLHEWEEPSISGTQGSGTVFFSGCSLGCIYCQNREISRAESGIRVDTERFIEIMLELQEKGAHNINFVTPTHYAPTIREAVTEARRRGLTIPTVYNTASYDTKNTIKMLEGTVDIYLADFKYLRPETARKYSNAPDYPETARLAIAEMYRQTGRAVIGDDGIMKRGTVVRILLLPSHVAEAKLILKYLFETYGDGIYISLMSQYTPIGDMPKPLDRTVTRAEYDELVDYAVRLGVTNCYIQEGSAASESFIPSFDNEGVLPADGNILTVTKNTLTKTNGVLPDNK